jgi:F-type H+-transporting ATPase subunit delta
VSASVIAGRYAQALLELGVAQGDLDKIVEEMAIFAAAWEASADLRNAVENPLVAHPAKKAVVGDLADRIGATITSRHALMLLVDRRRAKVLPAIARRLRELADARKGILRAQVTTAAPLSAAYYTRLQARLEGMTGKRVLIERNVDPSLIAGVVTRIGDRIIDGSLRTRLHSLRDAMTPPL